MLIPARYGMLLIPRFEGLSFSGISTFYQNLRIRMKQITSSCHESQVFCSDLQYFPEAETIQFTIRPKNLLLRRIPPFLKIHPRNGCHPSSMIRRNLPLKMKNLRWKLFLWFSDHF